MGGILILNGLHHCLQTIAALRNFLYLWQFGIGGFLRKPSGGVPKFHPLLGSCGICGSFLLDQHGEEAQGRGFALQSVREK